jgi:hypothetical protein
VIKLAFFLPEAISRLARGLLRRAKPALLATTTGDVIALHTLYKGKRFADGML